MLRSSLKNVKTFQITMQKLTKQLRSFQKLLEQFKSFQMLFNLIIKALKRFKDCLKASVCF